jgi:hypothetical protein
MFRKAWIAMVCAALIVPAVASDSGAKGSLAPNVLLTITVSGGGDSPDRSYALVTRGDNSEAEMMTGWRVPIPTTTSSAGEGDDSTCGSTTTFSYQNVGLTARLRAKVHYPDALVALRGAVEVSTAKEATRSATGTPRAPTIGAFQQEFSVLMEEGTPLELASVSKPEGGSLKVRLEVDILN